MNKNTMTRPESLLVVAKEKNLTPTPDKQAERNAFALPELPPSFCHGAFGPLYNRHEMRDYARQAVYAAEEHARSHLSDAQKKEGEAVADAVRIEDLGAPRLLDGVECQYVVVRGEPYPWSNPVAYVVTTKEDAERIVAALNTTPPAAAEAPAVPSDAMREALTLAREYVWNATQRMYDGTNGQGIRDEAKRRLALIDAALATKADSTEPLRWPEDCDAARSKGKA